MKIPKTIKIAGHKYAVKHVRAIERGRFRAQIRLERQVFIFAQHGFHDLYSESSKAQDVLHEILHGIDIHFVKQKLSESTITQLATGIFQVIRDNDLDFRQPKKKRRK